MLRLLCVALISLSFPLVLNAAGPVKTFQITVAPTAKVGEALDITVKAIDSDGQVKKDYLGNIEIYSLNDLQAKLPAEARDTGYQFTAADQGQKTFSKGLSFSKAGIMKIEISDFEDETIFGEAVVTVSAGATPTDSNVTVTITSPDNSSTIPTRSTNVSGTARKNSIVKLFVNGTEKDEVQSDDTGNFLFTSVDLPQDKNVLQVRLYDGNDQVIGSSKSINVTVSTEGPVFTSAEFLSGSSVQAGAIFTVSVTSESGLDDVTVSLVSGSLSQILQESDEPGVYVGSLTAPTDAGEYPIDIELVDALGNTTSRPGALTLVVLPAPEPAFQNVKTQAVGDKVRFTFTVINAPENLSKFQIRGEASSGSDINVETFTIDQIFTGGLYSWYIPGVAPESYVFTIQGVDTTGQVMSQLVSDPIETEIVLAAAPQCSIGNISGLTFRTEGNRTIMSWDDLQDATAYRIYKKTGSEYALVDTVKTNEYVIRLAAGAIVYEDFGLKGVCGADESESTNYADATRVQTGPGIIVLMMCGVLAVIMGCIIVSRRA